jgi:long-subunit acyl-CoA synthetase (AMP-forming)
LGAILLGAVTVPIFNNISEDNLFYELSDCDAKFFFTDNEKICVKIKEKFPQVYDVLTHIEPHEDSDPIS